MGAGIGFLSHLLLARLLDPSEYGVYVFAWTIVVLLGTFCGIGLPVAATKFVATYQDQKQTAQLNRFSRYSVVVALGVTAFAAIALVLLLNIVPETLIEAIYRPALFVGAFCIPLFTLTEIGKGLARGLGRNVIAMRPAFCGVRSCWGRASSRYTILELNCMPGRLCSCALRCYLSRSYGRCGICDPCFVRQRVTFGEKGKSVNG